MTTVVLERTVDNRFDQHAIAIKTLGGDQLGSIARTENRSTHPGRFYCPPPARVMHYQPLGGRLRHHPRRRL